MDENLEIEIEIISLFSWMDSRKMTRVQNKVKGTGKWQKNYLTPSRSGRFFNKTL